MTDEAIVLAGGLGTRLRSIVKDVPKPMAEINGRPFLDYILHYLYRNNIKRVVMAVGYKYTVIQDHLENANNTLGLQIDYSIEHELLGTGGAISQALNKIHGANAFVVNGDTYFDVPLISLEGFAQSTSADIAIALKSVPYSDRYGQIHCSENGRVLSFSTDLDCSADAISINGGIYHIRKNLFQNFNLPTKFSIENDFYHPYIQDIKAFGKNYDNTFIDIGVPRDYNFAQNLLKNVI